MTQEEFTQKYNDLVKESGFQIIPKLTLGITPVTPVEAPKEETKEEVTEPDSQAL